LEKKDGWGRTSIILKNTTYKLLIYAHSFSKRGGGEPHAYLLGGRGTA